MCLFCRQVFSNLSLMTSNQKTMWCCWLVLLHRWQTQHLTFVGTLSLLPGYIVETLFGQFLCIKQTINTSVFQGALLAQMGCSSALLPPDHIAFSWLEYFTQVVKLAHASLSTSWIQRHSLSPLSRRNWTSTPKNEGWSLHPIRPLEDPKDSSRIPVLLPSCWGQQDLKNWLFIQLGYSIGGFASSTTKSGKPSPLYHGSGLPDDWLQCASQIKKGHF